MSSFYGRTLGFLDRPSLLTFSRQQNLDCIGRWADDGFHKTSTLKRTVLETLRLRSRLCSPSLGLPVHPQAASGCCQVRRMTTWHPTCHLCRLISILCLLLRLSTAYELPHFIINISKVLTFDFSRETRVKSWGVDQVEVHRISST